MSEEVSRTEPGLTESMPTIERVDRPLSRELKFLVSASAGEQIREWARWHMAPDLHGAGPDSDTYQTNTLYFDTRNFDVFHRRGSFGRSKYRVRRYGSSACVFLERKMRTGDRLSKRRTIVGLDELSRLEATPDPSWPGAWIARRLLARQLAPVCVIRYRRVARLSMTAFGPIRLTLDEQAVAWRTSDYDLADQRGAASLLNGEMILELKYQFALPALFKQLAGAFGITQRKLSKYRLAAPALGLVTSPPARMEGLGESCPTS